MLASQLADLLGELPVQGKGSHGALPGVGMPAREVGGQVEEGGGLEELVAPVGELVVEVTLGEAVTLPDGVVGVLDGQLGQLRLPPLRIRLVEFKQFRQQDLVDGNAVEDNVMQGKEEPVLVLAQANQRRPDQRAGGQIEGAERVSGGKP